MKYRAETSVTDLQPDGSIPPFLRFPSHFLARAALAALLLFDFRAAQASGIAYGTVNNFDTVNDTSNLCHGFEIELDDIHSSDITYTFDYNHHGTPKIIEDVTSVPGHTNVHVFYQATRGVTATGTATIAIVTQPTSHVNALDLRVPSGVNARFTGVPWYFYTAQRATNVTFTGTLPIRSTSPLSCAGEGPGERDQPQTLAGNAGPRPEH